MATVQSILETKGTDVWSVAPEDSTFAALELMAEKNIGAVVVLEKGKPVGILSERDYARGVVLKGRVSKKTPVSEIMSRSVYYVRPDQTVEECMALMADKHFRHLPVIDGKRLIGVISIGDVVEAFISRQDLKLRYMHNQIVGYDSFQRM